MSLRDIAATVGVAARSSPAWPATTTCHCANPAEYARKTVDRDWLYDQYVTKRRALPDIAEEAGMSTANMARWAETHAIPMRGRGGPSHSANLAAQRAVTDAPELIRPALAGIGGWERLHRFAAAARHGTLTVAAEELGVHQFTLVNQINRIERELGMKLLIRAERGRPMELTEDGARVAATEPGHVNARACDRRLALGSPAICVEPSERVIDPLHLISREPDLAFASDRECRCATVDGIAARIDAGEVRRSVIDPHERPISIPVPERVALPLDGAQTVHTRVMLAVLHIIMELDGQRRLAEGPTAGRTPRWRNAPRWLPSRRPHRGRARSESIGHARH